MSEEAVKEKKGTEWTEWSVVMKGDGTYRCRRTNVADEKDVEYRDAARPSFSPEELVAMIEFGSRGLMRVADLAQACYRRRGVSAALHLCRLLNANNPPEGAGK